MLLESHKFELALEMYRKLRCCAHTDKDALTKMYAYKQMGCTNSKMTKYDSAVLCFKFMLALAWTLRSPEAELAAYEGLAKMFLYMGQIEKSKFYDARIANGKYEPEDSQLFKITLSNNLNEHRWLRETQGSKIGGVIRTGQEVAWD